jgi:hypothetical protein
MRSWTTSLFAVLLAIAACCMVADSLSAPVPQRSRPWKRPYHVHRALMVHLPGEAGRTGIART